MTLTYLDLYNDITSQAWSMFDSEVEDKEEFEASVTTSIQKALADLWNTFDFPFKQRNYLIKTKANKINYTLPEGSITKKVVSGVEKYNVKYGSVFLDYITSADDLEEKQGEPENFYIENNEFCLYPTPDNVYSIKIGYSTIFAACDKDDTEQATLKEDDDYVNIPEMYEELFRCALLPLAMMYLIASETDENYSAYKWQYERALKTLIKQVQGMKKDRIKGW